MSSKIKKTLKKLISLPGVCGYESDIAELVSDMLDRSRFETSVDTLGNLIAKTGRSGGRRVMLSVPLDAPGLLVTFIDRNGMLHVSTLGSPALSALPYRRVISQSGVGGIIIPTHDGKVSSDSDLLIDIGATSKSEAEKSASIGDCFALAPDSVELGRNAIAAPAAGARACVAAALAACERLADADCELYILFTAQSRVGFRGAKAAAGAIEPEISVSLFPADFDGKSHEGQDAVALGDGVIILLRDGSAISDAKLYASAVSKAKKYSERVSRDSLTDASVIHTAGLGSETLSLCLPTKNLSTPCEKIDTGDADTATELLCELILSI